MTVDAEMIILSGSSLSSAAVVMAAVSAQTEMDVDAAADTLSNYKRILK